MRIDLPNFLGQINYCKSVSNVVLNALSNDGFRIEINGRLDEKSVQFDLFLNNNYSKK